MSGSVTWWFGVGASLAAVAQAGQPPEAEVVPGSSFTLTQGWRPPAAADPGGYAMGETPSFARPVFLDEASTEIVSASDVGGEDDGGLFDKGTWSLQLYGSYYDSFDNSDVTLAYGTASLGYYFADNFAVDLHLSGFDLEQDEESGGTAGSFGLKLRRHLLVRDPFSLYLDGGIGIIRADRRFPEGGTHMNFTGQGGLGVTYRLNESLHLLGGVRWFHISNARRRGLDRNASTDGTALYLGVMFTW